MDYLLEALKDDWRMNRESAAGALARYESYLNERVRWKMMLEKHK